MSEINLHKIKYIHFIGIGGIGMSSLARHFLAEKKVVSGSDRELTDITKALAGEGVQVMTPQGAENIADDIELVIYTEAITPGSDGWTELETARAAGVPVMNYFDALGLAMNPYHLIAVAGTHGKTTTTAMITDILEATEHDPTAVIGSLRASTGSNYRHGKSKYAVVEACEYKADFLSLRPEVLVITNLEHEHVDYYQDLASVQDAFAQLVGQVAEGGVIVADTSDPNVAPVLADCDRMVVDYKTFFDPLLPLKQPGLHNRLNAAAAIAAATTIGGVTSSAATVAMRDFRGTWRRFEYKGEVQGALVYDDYAHHPTEIAATINAARELYPDKRLVTVFKPHTYSRTAALFDDFAASFKGAYDVLLLPIYAAREENTWGVTSRELAVKTLEYVSQATYVESHEVALNTLTDLLNPDTVVVVMGAGDVTEVANSLTQQV